MSARAMPSIDPTPTNWPGFPELGDALARIFGFLDLHAADKRPADFEAWIANFDPAFEYPAQIEMEYWASIQAGDPIPIRFQQFIILAASYSFDVYGELIP